MPTIKNTQAESLNSGRNDSQQVTTYKCSQKIELNSLDRLYYKILHLNYKKLIYYTTSTMM